MYVWEGNGGSVAVTPLQNLVEARGVENESNGSYQNTTVFLEFSNRRSSFTVSRRDKAQEMVVFLNVLAWIRTNPEAGELGKLPPHLMGGFARDAAGERGAPATASQIEVDVDDIPDPSHANARSGGLLWYVLIVLFGVGSVFALREINRPLRDEAVFDMVKGRPAPELRAYLTDKRNVRFRQQVQDMLAAHYAPPMDVIRQGGKDEKLRNGLLSIVESLRTAEQPAVSLRVVEKPNPEVKAAGFKPDEAKQREELARRNVTEGLCQVIGNDLVFFAEAPDGVSPMVDVEYQFVPTIQGGNTMRLKWTVKLRNDVEIDPLAVVSKQSDKTYTGPQAGQAVEEMVRQTIFDATGQTPTLFNQSGQPIPPKP
jgi:hypothetical protein